MNENRDEPQKTFDVPEKVMIECLIPSVLERSNQKIPSLRDLAAEHLLSPPLTTWYKALKVIKKLPDKIPPLPRDIHNILNSQCPEQICSTVKPDGTVYTVGDKCTLMLIPESLQNINQFAGIVRSCDINPFLNFDHSVRLEHANLPFESTHWVLHTNDVLENSQNTTYLQQVQLVHSLAQKTIVDWQVPRLHDTIATIFLKKIATGDSLYPGGNEQNGNRYSYTHVRERTNEYRLIVGGFVPNGLQIQEHVTSTDKDVGVAVLLKF
ncbi:MAG: hypothetical protein A3D96_07400 [Chlamydiae bacterium RIFCSPHIGHO2_12_FULL_44_59]|nr:MAG: hypothetical protein A2796_06710 [Chlamydiae bacterium RIFCSPHIGHO2_01_FULL_44_39]OGN59517.1 MAG: hypothetical protein A3D96_07400 [Chlamydiae bacterium RIFCSPHIGHO2_12_FULL_44_59]OGN67262.1 MAG: hypothetical protein A2978_03230 [Chlamydiae bacterium RIFCSPLOWO2_01_FULL_44_52]OGN68684.1 MAG: hypothetical protein A3I67_02960 [Chlamydiae bacterium RIFCSPLOWO2_02_FULL_45_22]OGN69205.1 MAG: hypothetical protein A3F79_04745 [Chlamydiae bacterium RIFCSPLOWO2_12_FULL_45_20]